MVFVMIGCASNNDKNDKNAPSSQNDVTEDQTNKDDKIIDETPDKGDNENKLDKDEDKPSNNQDVTDEKKVEAILYFSDENAEYLNGEERELGKLTAEALLNGLIEGPKNDANRRTIPDGTKLIDVKIEDGVAYVNFSKELTEKHWGGSTGETHTIFSIVNTLALNPELNIDSVQILVEGETIETLAGHMDISEPIEPNLEISKLK